MEITIYFSLHLVTFALRSGLIYLLIFMFYYFYPQYELQKRTNCVGYSRDCTICRMYFSLDFTKNNHCFALLCIQNVGTIVFFDYAKGDEWVKKVIKYTSRYIL